MYINVYVYAYIEVSMYTIVFCCFCCCSCSCCCCCCCCCFCSRCSLLSALLVRLHINNNAAQRSNAANKCITNCVLQLVFRHCYQCHICAATNSRATCRPHMRLSGRVWRRPRVYRCVAGGQLCMCGRRTMAYTHKCRCTSMLCATLFWHAVGSQQNAFLTNKGAAFVRMRARSLDLRAAIPSDQQVTACKARAASRRVFILLPASSQVSSGKKRQPTIILNIFLLKISILAI